MMTEKHKISMFRALFLATFLLFAQTSLLLHATDHSLHQNQDEPCELCVMADSAGSGLPASVSVSLEAAPGDELAAFFPTHLIISPSLIPPSRAPPSSFSSLAS